MPIRYFIQDCPLQEECSFAAWGRARRAESYESREECIQNAFRHMKTSSNHWNRKLAEKWDACMAAEVLEEEYESFPTERRHKHIKAICGMQAPATPPVRPTHVCSQKRTRSPSSTIDEPYIAESSSSAWTARPSTAENKVLIDRRILDDVIVHIGNARKIMKKGVEITESAKRAFEQQQMQLDRIMSSVSGAL